MQIDLREALEYLPENASVLQALELVGEEELVEKDVADIAGELGDVVEQIVVELAGVLALQTLEGEAAEIVDPDIVPAAPNRIMSFVGSSMPLGRPLAA